MDHDEPAAVGRGLDGATVAMANSVVTRWRQDLDSRPWKQLPDEETPSSQRAFGEAVSTILAVGQCRQDSDSPERIRDFYHGLTSLALTQLREGRPRHWVLALWLLRLRATHAALGDDPRARSTWHPAPASYRQLDASFLYDWYATVNGGLDH